MAPEAPRRVLLYRPPWRHGEPYFRAQQMAACLGARGHRVRLIAGPRGWRSLTRLLWWLPAVAWAQVVVLYPQPLLPLFALTAHGLRRRVLIDHFVSYLNMAETERGLARLLLPLERAAYRRCDAVLAHTETVAEGLRRLHRIPPERIHVVYSLVDTAHFAPVHATAAAELRRALGLEGRFVVLYHGLWHTWHGVDTLRRAVALMAEQGEPVALVLIGRAGEGAPHERLLGEVPYRDLPRYLAMGDVWCSGFESHPRGDRSLSSTLIQALAMGLPVITSPGPEKERVLRPLQSALFVPPGEPLALADAIRWCRDHPERARQIGAAGRRLAEERFDLAGMQAVVDQLLGRWFKARAAGASASRGGVRRENRPGQ